MLFRVFKVLVVHTDDFMGWKILAPFSSQFKKINYSPLVAPLPLEEFSRVPNRI